MAHAQTLASQLYASPSGPYVELRQSVPSQIEAISPFLEQTMRFIQTFCNGDETEAHIEVALREALTNAIVHGNREDSEKRVYVWCRCHTDGEIWITIQDQGEGFDSRAIPDPTLPENVLSAHGRGIYLIRALMDEVQFEEGGTVLKMSKKSKFRMNAEKKSE